MATKNVQHAEIVLSTRKTPAGTVKKFRVRYIGNNSELLAPSQAVKSRQSAIKNIAAFIRLANGTHMRVVDKTKIKWASYDLSPGNGQRMVWAQIRK